MRRMHLFILVVIVVIVLFLVGNSSVSGFEQVAPSTDWRTEMCGPNAQMVNIGNYTICMPNTSCAPETCPPGLGTCQNGTCKYNDGYKGVATYPHAMSTYYCNLSGGGCHGVTQNRFPEVNAGIIAGNLGLNICDKDSGGNECVGIAASPPMIIGNSEDTTGPDGKLLSLWGQGMTEYTGVCYELTGPTGKKAIVALTDRCGGYCSCNGSGFAECGPCVNASSMKPNCPCVGTVPGAYSQCCGLTKYGCPNTNQQCDWCSSNNHPHFDLDIGTYQHLLDGQPDVGSIELQSVRPVKCMEPLKWPPSGGGSGGYIPCPKSTWDTGSTGPNSSCTGTYLKPGDSAWPNSQSATHWCCNPSGNNSGSYVSCPTNTWDTGSLGASSSCIGTYLKPGDSAWPNSQNANHWCCVPSSNSGGYVSCPTGDWDTGSLGPNDGCTGTYLKPGDSTWPNSQNATHWCCKPK